jgi:hypothetical protein
MITSAIMIQVRVFFWLTGVWLTGLPLRGTSAPSSRSVGEVAAVCAGRTSVRTSVLAAAEAGGVLAGGGRLALAIVSDGALGFASGVGWEPRAGGEEPK